MFGSSEFKRHNDNGFEFIKISTAEPKANLIFLHGMFGGLSNYDPLIKHVQGYNIFVPAIPLYDFKKEDLTIRGLTEWLSRFCECQQLETPVILGNSMGGHLALDYALNYPQRVSALILTGSSGLLEREFGSTCPRRNDRDYIRKQANRTFYEDLIDEVIIDELMEVIATPSKLMNMLTIARSTHEYNMKSYLPEIKHDTLLVWGKHDEITPPEVARMFYRGLPNARLRWIDKCGHAPMMEHPKTFSLLLKAFLTELQNKSKFPINHEENHSHI